MLNISNILRSNLTSLTGVLLFLTAVIALSSCSKNKGAEALLRTVPENAAFVSLADAEMLMEHAGCDDGKPTPEFTKAMKSLFGSDWKSVEPVLNGESGVEFSVFSAFSYKENLYITGFVNDEDKFADYLKSQDVEMQKQEGGWLGDRDHIAVYDGQFWICSGTLDVAEAKYFKNLEEDESFLKCPWAEKMTEPTADAFFFGDIDAVIGMSGNQAASLRLAMGTLFKSAKYFGGTLTFSDGRADLQMSVLDARYKPAQTSMKLSTIGERTLADFPGKGDLYFSMAFSKEDLQKTLASAGGAMLPQELTDLVGKMDGTMVMGMNAMQMMASSGRGGYMVEIGFGNAADASAAVPTVEAFFPDFSIRAEGKYVIVDGGITPGRMQPAASEKLKGSAVGIVFDPSGVSSLPGMDKLKGLKLAWLVCTPKEGSLEYSLVVETQPSDQNALQTLIKSIP